MLREICLNALKINVESESKLGGIGHIVEIDETKLGRRKYERGRLVEGVWILGMIERGNSKKYRLEICPGNKRDGATLLEIIQRHVAIGTEIHTDCWRGYNKLEDYGYTHFTVNHSKNFVDGETGAHTQNIENSWRWLKARLTRGGVPKNELFLHFAEYIWFREVGQSDAFTNLCMNISEQFNVR